MTIVFAWSAKTRLAIWRIRAYGAPPIRQAYCLGGFYRNDICDIRVFPGAYDAYLAPNVDIRDIGVSQLVNTTVNTLFEIVIAPF